MIQALEITRYYAETPSSVNYDTSFRTYEWLLVDNFADLARGQVLVDMPFCKHSKESLETQERNGKLNSHLLLLNY